MKAMKGEKAELALCMGLSTFYTRVVLVMQLCQITFENLLT